MRLAAAALILVLTACGAPVAERADGDLAASVFVNERGVVRPLDNGARVALDGGGWARISFAPFPPTAHTELDVALEGVGGAEVVVSYEMVGMDHGAVRRHARASGDRYRAPLELTMRGAYRVTIEVGTASARSTVTLVVAGG